VSNVIELDEHRPYMQGEVICLQCGHIWQGVMPIGTCALECPACKCHKGVCKYEVLRDGEHWACPCGNDLLRMTRNGVYCPRCGVWAEGYLEED